MRATPHKAQDSHRRGDKGAVLVVVLLVMMSLLGLGLAGLYLTSGSIQMNANIKLRNQALYMAEAGINRARSVLNRPATPLWTPDLTGMLAGLRSPADVAVSNLGLTNEIPVPAGNGCMAAFGTGRGAYFLDEQVSLTECPGGGGRAYVDCKLPEPASQLGTYTLFIRQDMAECRLGGNLPQCETDATRGYVCTDANGAVIATNSIVVVRSEGVASDNRTKVVLEVTMARNTNAPIVNTQLATVCPAGQSGCDDNSSVQQGITVSGALTPAPAGAAGASGTSGTSGAAGASGGTGGATTAAPGGGTTTVETSSGGAGGSSTASSTSCSGAQVWCGTACCDGTCVDVSGTPTCCPKSNHCNNIAVIGEYGIWGDNGMFNQWLSTHSSTCNNVATLDFEGGAGWLSNLNNYGILIVLDLWHTKAEVANFYTNHNYWVYTGNDPTGGQQRILSDAERDTVKDWVRSGRGLMTTVGVGDVTRELTNPNKLLAPFKIEYDTTKPKWFLGGTNVPGGRINCWITGGIGDCLWKWVSAPLDMSNVANLQVDSGWALKTTGWGPVTFAEPLWNMKYYSWGKAGIILDNDSHVFGSPAKDGRVVAWNDEWLTYNHDWAPTAECPAQSKPGTPYWKDNLNSCTQTFWNNIISWLRSSCD